MFQREALSHELVGANRKTNVRPSPTVKQDSGEVHVRLLCTCERARSQHGCGRYDGQRMEDSSDGEDEHTQDATGTHFTSHERAALP